MNITSLLLVVSLLGVNTPNTDQNTYELIGLRSEYQKVIKLENGNYEFRYYAKPIHYWDGEKMIEIDYSNSSSINTSKQYIENSSLINSSIPNTFLHLSSKEELSNLQEGIVKTQNEYLVSNNEYYIFPSNINTINNGEEEYLGNEYSTIALLDDNVQYPLDLVQEDIVVDNDSPIKDKYITIGVSGFTESSVLLAGKDPLQAIGPNNNLVNYQYKTIFELELPAIVPASVVSATLNVTKNTTTTNANRNPNVSLYRITNDIEYDNIQGTSSLTTSLLDYGVGTASSYSFDIKSAVTAVASSSFSSSLLLSLEGTSLIGYASFHSVEAENASNPYLSIEVTDYYLGATLYGSAPEYYDSNDVSVNCLGYALCKNIGIDLELEKYSSDTEIVMNCVSNTIEDHGFAIRRISSYDSDIYNDEWRIAFRYNPKELITWHFIRQNNDGSWSGKNGNGVVDKLPIEYTPNDNEYWGAYYAGENNLHNFPTYYFAVKEE